MKVLFRSFAFNLAIIGLILCAFLLWKIALSNNGQSGVRAPATNPYTQTIAASGLIEAVDRNIEIGTPASGIVTEIYVSVSEKVKKGQPLFQVDPRELEAKLLVQEANLRVAEATLKRLQAQLKRLKQVSDPRAVSADLIETRENDVLVAEAQLKAAAADLEQTKRLIERLTVRAPRDGTILQNNIRTGERVQNEEPAMLLGNVEELQVRVDIDEQNASRFRPGMKAVAFPKNNPSIEIPLKFESIEPYVIPKRSLTGASNERVDTRVLQVLYTFDNPKDLKVFVGQQVDVFINEVD